MRLNSISFASIAVLSLGLVASAQVSTDGGSTSTTTPTTVTQLPAPTSAPAPGSFDQVVDRIVEFRRRICSPLALRDPAPADSAPAFHSE